MKQESLLTGMASIYGIYDIPNNEGYVNIGVSSDTAAFSINTLNKWIDNTDVDFELLHVTADGGGSNGSRNRLFKLGLQKTADKYDIAILVTHYPPGTSKWNPIGHRMFSYMSMSMRGKPLYILDTLSSLISNTTTLTGLSIDVNVDHNEYQTGVKIF